MKVGDKIRLKEVVRTPLKNKWFHVANKYLIVEHWHTGLISMVHYSDGSNYDSPYENGCYDVFHECSCQLDCGGSVEFTLTNNTFPKCLLAKGPNGGDLYAWELIANIDKNG